MILLNNYIRVKELMNDIIVDDIVEMYDSNSPYVIAEIIEMDNEVEVELGSKTLFTTSTATVKDNYVAVFRRISKVPILGTYCVHKNDLVGLMTREEYEKYIFSK